MATISEKTFGARLARAVKLYDRVKGEGAYNPKKNALITKTALETLVQNLGSANTQVGELAQVYNQAQDDRLPLYYGEEGLRKRVAMARDVIGGFQNGKKLAAYKTLQGLVQQMRSYRKPSNDPLPDGATPTPTGAPTPSQAQTSFGSLLQMGRDAVGTLKAMGTQYETDNALVTVPALEAFIKTLEGQDTTINDALTPLRNATKARYALYEGEEGLKARMTAVKSHVAGEHKKTSPLYKDLVKIKY